MTTFTLHSLITLYGNIKDFETARAFFDKTKKVTVRVYLFDGFQHSLTFTERAYAYIQHFAVHLRQVHPRFSRLGHTDVRFAMLEEAEQLIAEMKIDNVEMNLFTYSNYISLLKEMKTEVWRIAREYKISNTPGRVFQNRRVDERDEREWHRSRYSILQYSPRCYSRAR